MVWPKDPPQSNAQPQASAKPQGVHPPGCGPITAQLGPAQWASRQPGPLTWTLLLLGPGCHCSCRNSPVSPVGNERRFVFADADNRRYRQKDHFALKPPRLPHLARLAPRQEPEFTVLPCSTVFEPSACWNRLSDVQFTWRQHPAASPSLPVLVFPFVFCPTLTREEVRVQVQSNRSEGLPRGLKGPADIEFLASRSAILALNAKFASLSIAGRS